MNHPLKPLTIQMTGRVGRPDNRRVCLVSVESHDAGLTDGDCRLVGINSISVYTDDRPTQTPSRSSTPDDFWAWAWRRHSDGYHALIVVPKRRPRAGASRLARIR